MTRRIDRTQPCNDQEARVRLSLAQLYLEVARIAIMNKDPEECTIATGNARIRPIVSNRGLRGRRAVTKAPAPHWGQLRYHAGSSRESCSGMGQHTGHTTPGRVSGVTTDRDAYPPQLWAQDQSVERVSSVSAKEQYDRSPDGAGVLVRRYFS